MLAKVCSATVMGVDACPIEVEVDCGSSDTMIVMVGLRDSAVRESHFRAGTALGNSGFRFPMCETTLDVVTSVLKEEGPSCDSSVAMGMQSASVQWASSIPDPENPVT